MRRLSARWVLPMDGAAIERGALLIDAVGRVAAVGPDSAVPRPDDALVEDLGEGLLLPGLINTHTHLELTGLEPSAPEADFAAWIREVRRRKAERDPEAFLFAACAGLRSCYATGVTTVADTGDSGAAIQALAESGGSGIAYHEVFGPHPDQLEDSMAGFTRRMETLCRSAGGRVRLGVSPHAPYSVSGGLYAAAAGWARAERLPMAVHVAESAAESALLADGAGDFADAWRQRGIPLPEPLGDTPVQWLDRHGVLGPDVLCIHVVRAGPGDVELLARRGAAVAHCPVSNLAHGHGRAPLGALLAAGIRVGVGTDSVLSVGRLDLLAEARLARSLAGLDAMGALRLCTIAAAAAIGLGAETGSLSPGKWADCVVLYPPSPAAAEDPAELALASGPDAVRLTILGGKDVYRAGRFA